MSKKSEERNFVFALNVDQNGFHTSFVRQAREQCEIILICLSCHASFDPD